MKIKRFTAANMQAGLKTISETLGPEAVILSNRRLANGLEIVAGVDEQEYERFEAEKPVATSKSDIIKANPSATDTLDAQTMQHLFSAMSDKNKKAFPGAETSEIRRQPQPQPQQKANTGFVKPQPMSVADAYNQQSESPMQTHEAAQSVPSFSANIASPVESKFDVSAISMLRQEIDGLKELLREQTEQLREPAQHTVITPQYERLENRLELLGFGDGLIRKMLASYDREDSLDQNWRRIMGRLASALPVPMYEPLANGGVYALAGPTGAGKTTTIAKLAAHAVRDHGVDSVAVLSLDWYQVGGQEILRSVTDILGVEFKAFSEQDDLTKELSRLSSKRLILIDTSGSAEALAHWNKLSSMPDIKNNVQTLLVLPATMLTSAVNQFIQQFKAHSFAGTILSKLDESACFGGVLEPVMKHRWPLWYCTFGQNIPQDIETADARKLTQRLVKGLKAENYALATAS